MPLPLSGQSSPTSAAKKRILDRRDGTQCKSSCAACKDRQSEDWQTLPEGADECPAGCNHDPDRRGQGSMQTNFNEAVVAPRLVKSSHEQGEKRTGDRPCKETDQGTRKTTKQPAYSSAEREQVCSRSEASPVQKKERTLPGRSNADVRSVQLGARRPWHSRRRRSSFRVSGRQQQVHEELGAASQVCSFSSKSGTRLGLGFFTSKTRLVCSCPFGCCSRQSSKRSGGIAESTAFVR